MATKHTKLRLCLQLLLLVAVASATTEDEVPGTARWSRRTHSKHLGHRRHRIKRQYEAGATSDDGDGPVIPQDVVLGQREYSGQQRGQWSEWGQSSTCSRTCGGGVSSQTRECLDFWVDGSSLCLGPNKKFLSCNIQDCPEGSQEFRAEQCSRFDGVPFDGKYYHWTPYTKGPNKCELNCRPNNENFYYRHARQVIDGTRCNEDSLDVCVEGTCLPVGCDRMLGSEAKEDKCRKCGGDGSSCETVVGVVDQTQMHIGYNDILLIPAGATNIVIQERQATNNYLAIRNLTGHYYLNGNWRIDFPRDLNLASTVFYYERRPHAFVAPESLRALGPTTEPLFVVLLFQEANPGISYEYSVPLQSTPSPSPPPPEEQQDQPQQQKPFSWIYGNFGDCSHACGRGLQTRNVSCVKSSNVEIVDDSWCDPHLRPSGNQTCNIHPCPASWEEAEWEPCSTTCGDNGVQFRGVYCQQVVDHDVPPSVVNISLCDEAARPKRLRPCSDIVPCPRWYSSAWSSCDKLCGAGQVRRSVSCQRNVTGKLEVFPDAACDLQSKPSPTEECDSGPCEGVDWIVTEWSGCESCGILVESRQAHCSSQSGKIHPAEVCEVERLPSLERNCSTDAVPCDDVLWHATQWSECSSQCGSGVQTRQVFCGRTTNDTVERTSDDECDPDKRYSDSQSCTGTNCTATWFTGPWNRCTAPCGGGHRTRKVICLEDEQVTNGSNCDAGRKPFYKEPCNTHRCDEDEILVVGGCKDSRHGCCPDGITLAGPNYEGCPSVPVPVDGCATSEFGCCSDGVTPALGPFRKGCPRVYRCKDTKFGCCPDGVTPAKGAKHEGCPAPESCAATHYGCCPDGVSVATGNNFAGCDFEASTDCLVAQFGCCPDGITAAEGSGYDGCDDLLFPPDDKNFTIIDESGSGVECNDTAFGCCPDDLTPAEGPHFQGCPLFVVNVTTEAPNATADCELTEFGCCPDDGLTPAQGLDFEGCANVTMDENDTAVDCGGSQFGCCLDNATVAEGPDMEGCPGNVTITTPPDLVDCNETEHGCCPDNVTAALGPDASGCDTNATCDNGKCPEVPECHNSTFGCCSDGNTTATRPDGEGCDDQVPPLPSCHNATFGCCAIDGVTEATGPDDAGCPTCEDLPFGCCYDGRTPARGERYEGCGCETFPYGCCPDGETFARGPNNEGCGCQAAPYGCCPDVITIAQGHNYDGCGCETHPHGCCPDGRTPARGPQFQGCGCETWYYGCCPDGRTAARGPNQEGCDCHSLHFGCCPDGVSAAQGPDHVGCPTTMTKQTKAGDVCGLPKERGDCRNFTVKWFFDMDYGGCSRFWYGGCDGNDNRFDSQMECQQVCVAPEGMDACLLPRVIGPCEAAIQSWYYDNGLGSCQQFLYGGCLGNNNRFETQEKCDATCQKPHVKDPCLQPVMEGPCHGHFERWFFDIKAGTCKRFVYGGCKGNNNNFESERECLQQCSSHSERDVCLLPRVEGPCYDYQIKWYYDKTVQRCGQFYYGGCDGNGNRFETEGDCMSLCASVTAPPPPPGEVCSLPRNIGSCNSFEERWYHDHGTSECLSFIYSGCEGNDNNFGTKAECLHRCPAKKSPDGGGVDKVPHPSEDFLLEYCYLEHETGPCYDSLERWHYDRKDGVCKNFQYGGCQGNGNRFTSRKECEDRCFASQNLCTLPKIIGPCSGAFHQWSYDQESNSCEEFLYGGCEGNANRFDSSEECENRCIQKTTPSTSTTIVPEVTDVCQLPSNSGPCLSHIPSWYYDVRQRKCQYFIYGGCEGNANRFETEEECERSCGQYVGQDVCDIPQETGPCVGALQKWYYDKQQRACLLFLYGGCDGNGNRFSTLEECERTCPTSRHPEPANVTDTCRLAGDPGPCTTYQNRWFYDFNSDNCVPFTYGGCGGNTNRFESFEECMRVCGARRQTCEEPTECYSLQCPYGIEQFHDHNRCPHCRCSDPCAEQKCPDGSRCSVEQHQTEDGEPRIQAVCRLENKDGVCPSTPSSPANGNDSATCGQECQTDADCYGSRKCCSNGCGNSCMDVQGGVTASDGPAPTDALPGSTEEPPVAAVIPPHIATSEPEVVASTGSSVTLPCVAQGNPHPTIEWYGPTGESLRTLTTTTEGETRCKQLVDGSLQIESVALSDAGDYVCIATSPAGTAEQSTRLVVHDQVPTPAHIEGDVHVVVTALEKPCMLHCKASGWPRPSVTWWRETRMLPRVSEKYQQFANYTLLVRTMTTHDLGPYQCKAYNGIGQVAVWEITVFTEGQAVLDPSDAKLKYFGPEDATTAAVTPHQPLNDRPTEHPSDVPDGDHLDNSLDPNALPVDNDVPHLFPPPSHQVTTVLPESLPWPPSLPDSRNDVPDPPDSHSTHPDHSHGTHLSPDTNETVSRLHPNGQNGHVDPVVDQAVTANIVQNKTDYMPDDEIQLDCVTSGPSQRTLWYKDGQLLKSNGHVLVFGNGTLLVRDALPIDAGRYDCEASSLHSRAVASIDIKVEGVSIPDDCTDSPFFANCKLIVKAKYCVNKYYSRFCCRSCALDGQINPSNGDISNNLV